MRWFPVAFFRFLVGASQPKPFVHMSPAENSAILKEYEETDLGRPWSDLDPYIHWLGPPLFLPWCSEATLSIWSERLPEGPYQGSNSVIQRPNYIKWVELAISSQSGGCIVLPFCVALNVLL